MPFKRPLGERAENLKAPNFIRPLQDKRVVVGQNVILECQVEGHPDPVVKWLKDGQNVTQCPDYEIKEDGVKHMLVIQNVQASDNGRFTIQAMNAAATKQSSCMLIVAPAPTPIPGVKSIAYSPAPPQTPVGPSAPLFLKEIKNQPLKPGTQVVLEARVVGNPTPQVEWLKNGSPLRNYRARTEYDPQSGICSLTIPQMFADDIGEYTCKATNTNGVADSSAHLLPRDEFEKWFHDEQSLITKERKQTMLAQTQQAQGRSSVSSQKQYGSQQQQAPQRPTSAAQRQMQKWGASNGSDSPGDLMWGISESETEPELAALEARGVGSKPIIRTPLRGLRLTEGTDAILQCNIVGNPKPRIEWLKNGITMGMRTPSRITMTYRGSLAILKISMVIPDDSGEYTLIGENNYGRAESSARVEVYPLNIPDDRPSTRATPQVRQTQQQFNIQQQQEYLKLKAEQEQSAQHQQYQSVRHAPQQPQYAQRSYQEELRHPQVQQAHYQPSFVRPSSQQAQYQQSSQQQYQRNLPAQEPYYRQQQQEEPYRQQRYQQHEYQEPYYSQQRDEDLYYQQYIQEQQRRLRQQPLIPAQINYQQQYLQHNPHQYEYQQNLYERQYQGMPVTQPRQPLQPKAQAQVNGGPAGMAGGPPPVPGRSTPGRVEKPPQFVSLPASTTVKGGDAAIFKAKAIGQPMPQLRWYRSDGSVINPGGRYSIENFPDGSTQLKISNCTADDADTYLCVADNGGGAVQSRCSLNVLEPRVTAAPQFVGKFQSVTVFEGDSLMLYCKASGEGIKMTWSKDGAPLEVGPKYKIDDKGNGETTLHINNAKMADGGWYQCDASNQSGTSSLKGRVVVQTRHKPTEPSPREQITLRKVDRRMARMGARQQDEEMPPASKEPPKLLSQLKSLSLIEGQTALLECKFSPSDDPNLKIAWLLNGKALLASSRVTTVSDFGHAVLEINPVTVFDAGEYTIIAVNTLGETRQTAVVDVVGHRTVLGDASNITTYQTQAQARGGAQTPSRIAEKPNFHTELRSMEVFDGQNVHLEAKVTPINDPNLKVEWFLNGNPVKASSRIKSLHDFGFVALDIASIVQEEAGTYVCRATNEVGSAESVAVILVQPREVYVDKHTIIDVEDAREMRYRRDRSSQAPIFHSHLSDFHCDQELGKSYFEARVAPVNDPSMRVIWLKDGQGLPNANRIQTFQNFGCVALTLNPTYPEDAGQYTCVVRNAYGESQSTAYLTTVAAGGLQLESKHEGSLAQIGYLEGHQVHIGPQAVERPEEFNSMEPPRFARQLASRIEVNENEAVHFECRVQPAGDVKMAVDWYHNGAPLAAAHRFRPMFDFGYVALDILYAYPEDSGTYTVVARNELGEVQSDLELVVNSVKRLYTDPQHPEGLERIQELEKSRIKPLEHPPDRECDNSPQFIGDLQDLTLSEGENIHLDLRILPVNDPTMVVDWFVDGRPLLTGSRVKPQFEFGFISIDVTGAIAEDSGVYSCRATNALGEAVKECQISVTPHATVVSETQHEESLGKIHQIESLNKYGRKEVEDEGPQGPPQFTQPLPGSIGEIEEGHPIHLECQVRPVGDNTLTITWLKDGRPIPTGHRFRTFHDFGFVSLDILDVYAEDTGTYTCVAKNAFGQAETSVSFLCNAKAAIIGQTQHPTSVKRIQEIEAPKPAPQEAPDAAKQVPQFIKPLSDGQMVYVTEGDNVYLEAQVIPTDDNSMTYEWLLNGRPLMKAHRFVLSQDFGFIALNILYMYPEDSGTYTLIVRNSAGEASSTMDIDCAVKGNMITESFHPNSIQRIRELEMPLQPPDERPEAPRMAPQIVRPLPPQIDNVHESQTLHLEAQILPVDDNQLVVEWLHNGNPLKASSRYRLMNDFGFVSLDIDFIISEDAGTYTLVVRNPQGRAETSTAFEVELLKTILMDTNHPESLRRIREIEAMQPAKPAEEELAPQAPVFTQELTGPQEILKEGQSVHMDCMVQPINDPNLRIEWFLNGYPILFGSRIRTIHDFGYVGLEFLHVHPEDTGTYICRASNAAGEAATQFDIECKPRRNIYLDTQHAESWAKIQEIENREVIREPSPDMTFPPPTFTEPLQNQEGLIEGDSVRLECRLQPANDPTLKVYWTKNGQPLPEGSRFMPARNFDYVNLDLLAVYGEDSGVYSCRAVSEFGEATTSCTVKCQSTDALLLETQHEKSWNRVQEIENRRPEEPIYEEPEKVAPRFVNDLPPQLGEFAEGTPVHFEGRIEPINDNKLTVEWYHNGHVLANGHRFRTTHDFGYVSLDILYAFPEDSGEWACVARNELGEAQSTTSFTVAGRDAILMDTQHPESWQRIQQIEAPKAPAPEIPELKHGAPQFVQPMDSLERIENQPAHFQTRVTPINDPTMIIQWFKDGAPLQNSNRFHLTTDFGFITLDIGYTVPEDSGTYTVVARNQEGEDQVEAQLAVQALSSILGDVQHENSWQKIQLIEQPKLRPEAEPEIAQGAPKYVRQLNSIADLIEGQPAHFEAAFEPITDPNMMLIWYHNGRPLAASSRMTMRSDFGLCTLDIHYVLPEDIGEFRCVARNAFGEDETAGTLQCQTRASILGDVQHVESWRRIQEIEAPKPAPTPAEPTVYAKPTFTQPLQSLGDLPEGSVAVLEARVIPVNDPNLKIFWFHNDAPLQQSNWHVISNDFGCVSLRIAPVYAHHSGVYSCKAVNEQGAAVTSASITVLGEDSLQLDTQHPQSLQKIQQLEALDKFPRLEAPEQEFGKPNWIKSFDNIDNLQEGEVVHLNGQIEPVGDPNLRIEWYLNGAPLQNSNRYRHENDFGHVTLTIVHVLPQDSGVYTCKAVNREGDATTSATVKVAGYEAILLATQHPVSWEKIQILETPAVIEEMEEVIEKEKPRFLSQLESATDVPEGAPVHLEATFQPARDPDLKVVWLRNGQPLGASQLVKTRSELGWAALDINGVNPDHNGIYTLKIINSEGEAASSASIKVAGVGDILTDTSHEESWRQIQIIEAPKEKTPEAPLPVYDTPTIQEHIADVQCQEGEPAHFEAIIAPTNDPKLVALWLRNGQPLAHGSKYAISQDFGFCTLDIHYTYPEDQGLYQLRVVNESGEAVSSATLKCQSKDAILGATQHEESWRRIQEIEAPKAPAPEMAPAPKIPPKFITSIQNLNDLYEGQPAHFEATVEPIDDPDLKIQWYLNGAPVTASSRVKMISDFGWIILDINQAEPRDSGEWTCQAINSAGQAQCSATVNVLGKESIIFDSVQPQSLQRIREIEAAKPAPAEAPAKVYEAPQIVVDLQQPAGLSEGDSVHLESQFTPVDDPRLKVEWFRNGQPLYHANRYKMVHDFGFSILDIVSLFAQDAGEYTMKVSNDAGEAFTSTVLEIATKESIILKPQDEGKARAVQQLEEHLHRKPEEMIVEEQKTVPVFIEPLSAPISCEEGDRVYFSARYEPLNDNQLQIQWFLNGKPLKTGSRVKAIHDFGFVILEIAPAYPEDSGEYSCRAFNKIGEAVTSTQLTCTPKQKIITESQLPERMSGASRRIAEIEAPRAPAPERPDVDHGPPRFVTQLQNLTDLTEGQLAHLEVQVEPVADPRLKIEWFHNGRPVGHTSRMKNIHDFGFVVLELSPAEPQDCGTWTCRATNDRGQAEVSCEISVKGASGIVYDWQSPAERKERINQLEEWIHRPKEDFAEPLREYEAPHFTQELQDLGQMNEADATAFTCVLEPIGDPSLRIEWQHNGHSIPYSNRIYMTNDFGVATLLIKHLIAQDSGEYRCIARNSKGTAETVGHIDVASVIQIDTPQIVEPLVERIEGVQEGDSIHMECRVSPINDPKLSVHWLRNGTPLPEASRFKPGFEFGFVTLDILYAYPEDNGVYECIVVNDKGEASTSTTVTVLSKPALEFAPQAPGSNLENLESHMRMHTRAALALSKDDAYNEATKQPPVFKIPLTNIGVEEGEYCRFETQIAPVNDPYLKVDWYKDKKPVLIGHRFRSTVDFGFACLDVLYALPDDTGEYTCVATNRYGQAMISAQLACSGTKHIITESQLPQGVLVSDVRKLGEQPYWSEQIAEQPRQKQAPQFTIKPANIQAVENEPARFECAVIGHPKPKVTWYINGNQALHGHRYKLNYDGIYYLTISNTKISDAGEIVAIAKNSEGEVLASAMLDVFQKKDFRHVKLKPTVFKTLDELQEREINWQRETLGQLGEAFENVPRPDQQKLMKVERSRSPVEPLESEELMEKFTRTKDDQFYDQLAYIETARPTFQGVQLETVALKAGRVLKYEAPKEEMESVKLKAQPKAEKVAPPAGSAVPQPTWATEKKLGGDIDSRFNRLAEPTPEPNIPARDQVQLKGSKPKLKGVEEIGHVEIEKEKAKLASVVQAPEVPKAVDKPAKDQVHIKQLYQPKPLKPPGPPVIETEPLKGTPPVVKGKIAESTISSKPQPTKMGQTQKAPPQVSTQLKPVQAEIGRTARFYCAFTGALPMKVTWFKDGKEIKPSFEFQINTTNTGSTLSIGKIKPEQGGEYTCRIENVAGTVESLANLAIAAPVDRGVMPDFKQRMNDIRGQQNTPSQFTCVISGNPEPTTSWFKDGKPLPNDARYKILSEGNEHSLLIIDTLPQDSGVYECVAKNTAGEARCKARLNVILAKTGQGVEAGPRLEAPRFQTQIQPVVAQEGGPAEFRAKYTGSPEPTIRWYRNNEPIKKSKFFEISQANGEAVLRISECYQEDVAEYKCEGINPAGKATSIANLVLAPKGGGAYRTTIITKASAAGQTGRTEAPTTVQTQAAPSQGPPQFISKLSDISARAGHNVKFIAEISGVPQPTVAWQFNNKPLYGGRENKISLVGNKAILEIQRISQANAGDYAITIRNTLGAAQCQAKLKIER